MAPPEATHKRSANDKDPESSKRAKSGQAPPPPSFVNEYEGFDFSDHNSATTIDKLSVADITPESFYTHYISKRKPCILIGPLDTIDKWKVAEKWPSTAYLKTTKAANMEIAVEKRSSETAKFGQGQEIKLTFGKFLDALDKGDDTLYLTTQDVTTDAGGRPHVMSSLMQSLSRDFPIRPKIMGHLIPQNINVWMGCSNNKKGSSSGLHHDYHDNLYCIIQGKKRLDLYAPSEAPRLYPRGFLVKIHTNGRINYQGEETNADGSHAQAEQALDASLRQNEAAQELEEAEAAVERGEKGASERLEQAERALDEAMEAVMDAEKDEEEGDLGGFGNGDSDDDDQVDEDFWTAAEKCKQEIASGTLEDSKLSAQDDKEKGMAFDDGEDYEGEGRTVDKTVKNPLNFSTVDTTLDENQLQEKFPLFLLAKKATVEISPGEMLYLPASWFHEVTSYGGVEGKGRHMAFNYWFHPPDGSSFDAPYSSSFWPKDWSLRKLD